MTGKMLHELLLESLGKFLTGGEILGGQSHFYFISFLSVNAVMEVTVFFVLIWFQGKDEEIYTLLFIQGYLTVYPQACAHFFQLHYLYTGENGPVVLHGPVQLQCSILLHE